MVEDTPLSFQILIEGQPAMHIEMDHRLSIRDVTDCLHVLEDSVNVAQREGFEDSGIFERHIDGKIIRITHQ